MKVALFDICRTLVDTSTIREFTEDYVRPWRHFLWKVFRRLGLTTEESYRNHFARMYCGYTQEYINSLGLKYANDLQSKLKTEIVADLYNLKQEGYQIYLVSAGFDVYLKPFAEILGVNLVCTELEVVDGLFTGKIAGIDCYGDGKVTKVKNILPDDIDWQASIAYGDHYSDIPILSFVGTAVAVDPVSKLQEFATEKGWQIKITKKA